ncbi:MAG: tyrosine-type recombinase/integrase [Phycisphaerae bacterium]|nr:tyrosine-type recombinase/integrase [Phycisphaerae bacterium]
MAWKPLMNAQRTMRSKVQAYLAERRLAGFDLSIDAQQLARFARFTDDTGYRGALTVAIASRWALASEHGRRLAAARRVEVLRGFARYCLSFEPGTEIPPRLLFGPSHRRLTPHIYTVAEIRTLLHAASTLTPVGGLCAAACATLFGLIAATGLRISEAAGLKRADVDLPRKCLHVREGKYHKSRFVPLHSTTAQALQRYARRRDLDPLTHDRDDFFAFDYGRAASAQNIHHAFKVLRRQLGWSARGAHRLVRIHDLRHTFITRRL